MSRDKLQEIIDQFDAHKIGIFFRTRSDAFAEAREPLQEYNDAVFSDFERLGEFRFDETQRLIVVAVRVGGNLTERSSKKAQYDKAKRILKDLDVFEGGIFIFYDTAGSFRFSLVYERSIGTRRTWNNFRRFTYFVSKELPNKTFINRIGEGDFSSLNKIREAFSIAAVTNDFYQSFVPYFEKISKAARSTIDDNVRKKLARDFALLFVIRVIFIGFIQKRKWIGDDEQFLRHFWEEYRQQSMGENHFYKHWLEPLFFEALNSPIGRKVKYGNNTFSPATESALQMAPYLNGGLFKRKRGVDDQSLFIPDDVIGELFDWLFSYNFTIEENTLYDEELELNPEFLGIIFERLVNKADGAVYTPRVEVDFMCRLSLVKWLDKNTPEDIHYRDLYELFFSEVGRGRGEDTDQKKGSFSERQAREILEHLESITICDPAVGSGAFPVGMLHIIDEVEEHLRLKISDPVAHQTAFDRKKRIIGSSLYGVEVKEWAVWITQLRLWITLFIDAPDDLRNSLEPILPSLDFKVRAGDSLLQRIGTKIFPVAGHANVSQGLKKKITELKKLKLDYFQNKADRDFIIRQRELALYRDILNAEIDELTKTLRILRGIKPDQQSSLFSKEIQQPTQAPLSLNAEEVKKIENQIAELQGQQRSLSEDHPLIWNIEFAEIFADRDGFDIIIGNPPYVRQEDIGDPNGKIKDPKEYKKLLQEMVRTDFPRQFPKGEKIDAKSDLYTYFYIRSLKLLNPNGVLTFICSNSWLDVGYGVWLQKFLLKNAPIQFIIDNHAKRSFEAADINTIISVIEAPQKKIDPGHVVKFVAFKKSFEEVIFTENLRAIDEADAVVKNERYRVYPMATQNLWESGMEYSSVEQKKLSGGRYIGDKWGGKYLRAPDIYFTILRKGGVLTSQNYESTSRERERE
ncbi:MAG: Eco57I restriction-modification methylase domain-containing protein [Candidatus Andersenbacteria bacterium]|nr:Eco57I restriction-modification methylase domain-containing protein [Candidatus Andersenbacteria bacterium]MBI3251200.1 Eco57I restriction-modification methylase domain-containing protein [Candidatus Andersenbacteria bacterium]